jgi:CDP-paratose 2-epimerase
VKLSTTPSRRRSLQFTAVRVLVTGGAGFIGANVALGLAARHPDWELTALDNLRRRGAELNLPRLREHGIAFVHGDVRVLDDLLALGEIDAMVECSAEPSVLAGVDGSPDYVIQSNLIGAYHCLELARRRGAYMLFLSTSRVYPVAALAGLALEVTETRLELSDRQTLAGVSAAGISEEFPLAGARTLYGATKLSAELLIEEYRAAYGLRAAVNRCGVIAGPWQMGKVDQGVFTYWMLAHHFGRRLDYIGFGGSGKQVRDLLHVEDLLDLLDEQLSAPERWDGIIANVGGGREGSLSLRETTELCAEITGNQLEVGSVAETRPGDVPVYLSDCSRLGGLTSWRPQRPPRQILLDIHNWIRENERAVRAAL